MILWQANLGRGVSPNVFEANLSRVLKAGGPRAVFCFQEIDEADEPREMLILRRLTDHTHQIVGGRTSVPILIPRHLTLTGSRQTLGCRGLAKFTPTRPINEASVRIGPNVNAGILNFHVPLDRPQTQTRRAQVRKKARVEARKYPAGVWVADTNARRGWPTIVNGEKSVIAAGIDRAKAWAPDGWRIDVTDLGTVNLGIDNHDAHGARIRWVRS